MFLQLLHKFTKNEKKKIKFIKYVKNFKIKANAQIFLDKLQGWANVEVLTSFCVIENFSPKLCRFLWQHI